MEIAVVTGPTSGIGRAAALALAADGLHVVAAGRSQAKLGDLLGEIRAAGGSAETVQLDLASLRSVEAAASAIRARHDSIGVLINNAGVGGGRGVTEDGFELQFGTNHLGHFLLTSRLAPALSPNSRLVQVSSEMHRRSDGIDFERVQQRTRSRTGIAEYSTSKLANLLFVRELARRRPDINTYAVHPGLVDTAIFPWFVKPFLGRTLSPEEGADTVVWCATDPTLGATSGGYWARRAERTPSSLAQDDALAAELWEHSEEWCGAFN